MMTRSFIQENASTEDELSHTTCAGDSRRAKRNFIVDELAESVFRV